MAISTPLPRILPRLRFRLSTPPVKVRNGVRRAQVDLDLTLPEWDSARDLAEDFDTKMETFMAFDDHHCGAEREWLTG